ncbi:hypothetical protein BY996DRAFT_1807114 [Phakopsora pachyrhizi]|uniref:Expressed protein n=1 Tax=Phakopsora pachyrhizi TaxID=170000 RepID=A0AAV0ANY3_PHAPC|nr:hypothetical protein BY996DRAFT_1807114 [Phakopsora pachyrhizi]CAH7670513.1 expressed protein [Phakopsora pachyrhizi]
MANSGNSSNNYHQNQSNPRTFHSKLKNRRPDLTSDRSTENSTGSLRQTRDLRQTRLSSTDRLLRIRGSDNQASSSNQLLESYSEFRSNRELKNRSRASLPNLSDVRADPKDKGKLEDVKQGASSSDSTQTTPTKLITLKERDRNDSFQESCLPLGLDIETQCSPLAYQLIHPVQKIQTLNRSHGGWIEHQNQQQPPQETAAHRDISKDLKNLSDDDPNNPFNVQEEAPSNVIKTKKNQQTKFPTPLN